MLVLIARSMNLSLSALVLALALSGATVAQTNYPDRPVRLVVPIPPGPIFDAMSRLLAEQLSAKLGQPVVVENRPGAGQNIGAEVVANAAPDGYTLLSTPPAPLVVSQHLYAKLRFNPEAFVPISLIARVSAVVIARSSLHVASLPELIAYAKANPGKVSYGSAGVGSTPHLAMEQLASAAGIKLVHVPYQGLAPAMTDLLGGNIDVMVDNFGNAQQQMKGGRLKIIAATTEKRIPEIPGIATVSETLPGVTHEDWMAVVAPPKTPAAIAEKLSKAIVEVMKSEAVEKRLRDFSAIAVGSSPSETEAFIRREDARFKALIDKHGWKIE